MHKKGNITINSLSKRCIIIMPVHTYKAKYVHIYRTVQIFDGGNIDEFDKFPAIRQYFPYQNFPFS